jgi:putative Mn2+ efflux pump MntP
MVALLVVAVALGLNNFGAAIAIGVSGVDRRTGIKVATVFGLCDVVMPATGMLIGTGLAGPLGSAARWAGAGILFVTAVWGLIEALRGGDDTPRAWRGWRLLVSGAALSLDDLAVGLALGTVRYPIVLAVALFGFMSFVMSIIGLQLGAKLGTAAGEHGEVVGAIVLIGIAAAMAMGWLLPGRRYGSLARGIAERLAGAASTPAERGPGLGHRAAGRIYPQIAADQERAALHGPDGGRDIRLLTGNTGPLVVQGPGRAAANDLGHQRRACGVRGDPGPLPDIEYLRKPAQALGEMPASLWVEIHSDFAALVRLPRPLPGRRRSRPGLRCCHGIRLAVPRDLEGVEIGNEHHGRIDVVAVEVQDVPPVCDVLPVPILLIPRVERIPVVGHDRAADRERHAAEMVLELPDATVEFGATVDYPVGFDDLDTRRVDPVDLGRPLCGVAELPDLQVGFDLGQNVGHLVTLFSWL